MKITKLEVVTYLRDNALGNPPRAIPWNLLKVHTDEGVIGLGEPTLEGRARTAAMAVDELGDYIIGKDPLEVRRRWQDMFHGSFYRSGNIMASAVSGVEQALWDISGKWYGVPAYELMGGKVRDRIRMYAHARPSADNDTPEGWANAVLARKAEGFNAVKVMVVGYDKQTGDRTPVRRSEPPARVYAMADKIGAIRKAVGNDFDIAIELHGMFSPMLAKEFIKEVEQYRPMWIEEPMLPDNDDLMADIAGSTHLPIATGERLFTRWGFRKLMELHGCEVIQPDVCHAGGIWELKMIAAMAEVNFCGIAPHNPMGPVALAASFQVDAMAPNFLIQEHISLGENIITEPFKLDKDGFVPVPTKPGLGVEIDEENFKTLIQKEARGHLNWFADKDDGSFLSL